MCIACTEVELRGACQCGKNPFTVIARRACGFAARYFHGALDCHAPIISHSDSSHARSGAFASDGFAIPLLCGVHATLGCTAVPDFGATTGACASIRCIAARGVARTAGVN